jgi:hypothetical protein
VPSLDRQILTGPDMVARAAAAAIRDPEQRWMLRQPRAVRRAYAAAVYGRPDERERAMAWVLLSPEPVRRSYVAEVLRFDEDLL